MDYSNQEECLGLFHVDDQVGMGVRALCDLLPFACLFKEEPLIVISPLPICATTQWMLQPKFNPPQHQYLHPNLQIVYQLCLQYQTPEVALNEFTSQYELHKAVLRNDEELAAGLFIAVQEFRLQFQWICNRLKVTSQLSCAALRALLRLVIQWAFPIHSAFTDQRVATVFCNGNLLTNYLNHSCAPNCFVSWHANESHHVQVHTLRAIKAGEEITIAYHPYMWWQFMNRYERQVHLFTICQFLCRCMLCKNAKDSYECPIVYLQQTLQRLKMRKTDIDYTLCLYQKCSPLNNNMDIKILLRYNWEYLKMLFGHSRVSTNEWELSNIRSYPLFAGAAVERFVRIIMELDQTTTTNLIDISSLKAALHVFLKIPTLSPTTMVSIHFFLYELHEPQEQQQPQQWWQQFRQQFPLQYQFILKDVTVEIITHFYSTETIKTRWQQLYTNLSNLI